MGFDLGAIWASIKLNTSDLDKNLMDASRKLALADKQINTMGARLSANSTKFLMAGGAMVGAVAAVGVATVKMAKDFDTSMRNVNSIAKMSETEFKEMSGEVLKLSTKMPQSAKTLADGLYDIASSGFAGADGLKVLEASAKAASAGMTDTATSAKGITAVLNAYGYEAEKAAEISDTMFKTVDKGVITFEELSGQIGEVVGTANLADIEFNELSGALAYMTTKGIGAAEATTSLNRFILSIIDPSEELATVLYNAGYESGEAALKAEGLVGVLELMQTASGGSLTELQKLTPEMRALKASGALLGGGIEELNGYMNDFKDTTGATQAALDEQSKSLDYQLDLLKNNAQAIGIALGSELLPNITNYVKGVSEWISSNSKLATSLLKIIGGGVFSAGGFLGLAGAIGKARGAIQLLNSTPLGIGGVGMIGGITAMIGILAMYINSMWHASDANMGIAESNKVVEQSQKDLINAEINKQVAIRDTDVVLRAATEGEIEHMEVIEQSDQALVDYNQKEKEKRDAILESLGATELSTEAQAEAIVISKKNAAVLQMLQDNYSLTTEQAQAYAEENGLLETALNETTGAIEEQKQSVDDLRGAFNQLIDVLFDEIDVDNRLQEAKWAIADIQEELNKLVSEGKEGTREYEEKVNELDSANKELINSLFGVYTNIEKTKDEQEEARQEALEYGKQLIESGQWGEESFISLAEQFGLSGAEIIKKADEMGIKLDTATRLRIIDVNIQPATSNIYQLLGQMEKIKDKTVTINVNTVYGTSGKVPSNFYGLVRSMGGMVGYAGGGVIGMPDIPRADYGAVVPQTGRAIPILAHEGEMILNSSQQGNLIEALWGVANGKGSGGGVNVNLTVISPEPITPDEIARQTKNTLRLYAQEAALQ
jgi:TP901 family phage tail tape measure protein